MSIERLWESISPRLFSANGKQSGELPLANARGFKVGMIVSVSSSAFPTPIQLKVKRVINNSVWVGAVDKGIEHRENMSAYLLADAAAIWATEQTKPNVPKEDQAMASWEHEPANARRTIGVDELGNPWGQDNPMPVAATLDIGDITVETALDAFTKVPADNAIAVGTNDGTQTGVKRAHKIGADGKLEVKDTDANASLDNIETLLSNPLDVNTDGLTDAELRASPVPVTGSVTTDGLTDAELRASPVPVSGPLTDAELRASPVDVQGTVAISGTISTDGLTDAELRASPVPVSSDALTDTQLRASPVPVSGPLTDAELRASPVPVTVTGGGDATAANQVIANTILTAINTQLTSGVLKVDDDASQALLTSILNQLSFGGLIIGTEDGTPTGTQHVFVNNLRSMIMSSADRVSSITWLDIANKKDRRIDKLEFTSATFPGLTARKQFNYTLVGTEYVRTNTGIWSIV
jgi:hypothetical protein